MSEAHNMNQKSDSNESLEIEHATTVKSVPVANDAHTFSIIPAKSVVVMASEKPETVSETANKVAAPEMIHSTPLAATLIISTITDHIQSPNATATLPVTSTQKPALVFAETTNKAAAPIAVAAQIITATPMVEVMSVKPVIPSLNATDKSVNVTVETVSKTAVTTAVPMAKTNATIAERSTEKPTIQVVPEMSKLTATAAAVNSTNKPAPVAVEMMPFTAVPAIPTEKAIPVADSMTNNATAEVTTVRPVSSSSFVVTAAAMPIRRDKRQAANNTTKKPETATMKPMATTTKKPSAPGNTTPVFGSRVSTRSPVTRRARPSTPVRPITRQPVKLSPMPFHATVTMKPQSVTPKV